MTQSHSLLHPLRTAAVTAMLSACATLVHAHGDVTPQAVDTTALKQIGSDWLEQNPYRKNADAIRIGDSAFNQNCARCHGLGAVSGGIAPDLRMLPLGMAAAGVWAYKVLPMDAYPNLSPPMVDIVAQWPGHSAEEVEQQITVPMELGMNAIPGLVTKRSISLYGLSDVTLTFSDGTDPATGAPMAAVNLRCLPDLDLAALKVVAYDCASR